MLNKTASCFLAVLLFLTSVSPALGQSTNILGEILGDAIESGFGAQRQQSVVNVANGSAVYEYEVGVPAGRNGVAPSLTLQYNNQSASDGDMFGFGWSIDLPYIEVINKTGLENLYSDPTYVSSLSGELVQIGTSNDYRAKIEQGDFISYTLSSNTWTATDKDGTTYTFGGIAP